MQLAPAALACGGKGRWKWAALHPPSVQLPNYDAAYLEFPARHVRRHAGALTAAVDASQPIRHRAKPWRQGYIDGPVAALSMPT